MSDGHIIAIPGEVLDDKTINLWKWIRPHISVAIRDAMTDEMTDAVPAPMTWRTHDRQRQHRQR